MPMLFAMPQAPSSGVDGAVGGANTGSAIVGAAVSDVADVFAGAAQLTVKPPLMPLQSQRQGPSPVTSVGAPATHKSVEGLLPVARPLAGPQLASTLTEEAVSPPVAGSSVLGTATCAVCVGFSSEAWGDCIWDSAAEAVTAGAGAADSAAAGVEDGGVACAAASEAGAGTGAGVAAAALSGGGVQEFSVHTSCKSPCGQMVRVSPVILPT